ncbi:MAG: hypothetical protein RLZZ44_31 [Bacteroidota bacterium]
MTSIKHFESSSKENSLVVRNLFFGVFLVTCLVYTSLMDPINVPKMVVLYLVGIYCVSLLMFRKKEFFIEFKNINVFSLIVLTFGLALTAALSPNLYKAFLGETQRRNGFLTYFSLILFCLTIAFFYRKNMIKMFYSFTLVTSIFFVGYATLQALNIDFIGWSNPYNRVISFAGNPNFASSLLAILATLNFSAAIEKGKSKFSTYVHLLAFVLSIFAIYVSQARQGLLLIGLSCSCYIIFYAYKKKLRSRHLISTGIGAFLVISILGMLQIGPATAFLYKDSVSVRGYYWRAAIKMFFANPIFGVGIDNYGDNFKEFREPQYSLTYGYEIGSSNAHNVILQFLSTGGFVFGGAYLFVLLVFVRTFFKLFKISSNEERFFQFSIFTAWLQYQAQSLISIDNITISIWNWLFIGIIFALYREKTITSNKKVNLESKRIYLKSQIVFLALFVVSIVPLSQLLQSERFTYLARGFYNPTGNDANVKNGYIEFTRKALANNFTDPAYRYFLSAGLVDYGLEEEGLRLLSELNSKYPSNLDILKTLARIYETKGNADKAIAARLRIKKLDPWNAPNLLQLGMDYKSVGDLSNANLILQEVINFSPNSKEANTAASLL